jgi:hypothetical protein
MIKKTTLLLLCCAVVLGAGVYYFDWRRGQLEKPPEDALKPAYSFHAADVVSIAIAHPSSVGEPDIHLEKRSGVWQIVGPIQTLADQSTINGIVDQIAGAEVTQTEPDTADRRKAYGLDPPRISAEWQLQNGAKHTLFLGDKDFAGDSAYAIVDGGQNVSLLPDLLATGLAKGVDGLRDRAVLHVDSAQVTSLSLKSSSGDLALTQEKGEWMFTKPSPARGSADAVNSLLQAVGSAHWTAVANEAPENLSGYGLVSPAITFTTVDSTGAKSTLLVGKKEGKAYFSRDLSRPVVFSIDEDLHTKLSQGLDDLRDKSVVHATAADIEQIQIRNAGGSIVLSRKKDSPDEWVFEVPVEQKGKSAAGDKILDSLTALQAEQVFDHPAANMSAQLASPALTALLTDKNGKAFTIRFSKPSGDFVYAQTSDGPSLYKLKKQFVDNLNFKPADLVF